jgi:hypothetical protein
MNKYYRHFKGGIYRFIGIARHSETLEEMVVYQSVSEAGQIWVRPKDMFYEEIERDGKRGWLVFFGAKRRWGFGGSVPPMN